MAIQRFTLDFTGKVEKEQIERIYASGLEIPIAYDPDDGEFGFAIVELEHESFEQAVREAVAVIEADGVLRVNNVDAERYLELKDAARLLGRHRWRPRKLLDDLSFPQPVADPDDDPGDPPLWAWSELAAWNGDDTARENVATALRLTEELNERSASP